MTERYGSGVRYGFGNARRSAAEGGGRLPTAPITFRGTPRCIVFNGRGLSNPGTIYLCNCQGDARAIVVSTAGRILLRRWNGHAWQ